MVKKYQIDLILDSIREGLNITDSCGLAGVSRVTYYSWLKKRPGFKQDVRKARLTLKKDIISTILKASKKDWRAGMTYLERVYRKEFHVATGVEKEMNDRLGQIEEKLDAYLRVRINDSK